MLLSSDQIDQVDTYHHPPSTCIILLLNDPLPIVSSSSMSASETESGVDEWTVVQGRSEPSKTFRVLQRATVRTEAQATSTESPQQPDDVEPEKKSTLTRDLVGAPIRRRFYSPRQDRETGPGSSHSNHSGLNEKIGGILRLPRVSSTHPSSSSNAHINSLSPIDQDNDDLDLTDYGEWPSMSTVEPNSMAPRTPLWPILVESPKIQVIMASCLSVHPSSIKFIL